MSKREAIMRYNLIIQKIRRKPCNFDEILVDNNEELRISLKLHITYDFQMELFSFGPAVKVLQPENLARDMKKNYAKAIQLYQ